MKIRKKLLLLLTMIALTVITLGASTFAWLTLTQQVSVSNIQLNVSSGAGIEVSTDPNPNFSQKMWKSELTSADLSEVLNGVDLDAVTSLNGTTFTDLDENAVLLSSKKYIEFTLHFRVSNLAQANDYTYGIYLTEWSSNQTFQNLGGGTALQSKGVTFQPDCTFTDVDGQEKTSESQAYTCYAKDSIRISFTGTRKTSAQETTIFDLGGARNDGQGVGETNGNISFYNAKNPNNPITAPTGSDVTIYNTNLVYSNELSTYSTAPNQADYVLNNNSQICAITYDETSDCYYGTTVIRIWIEGWDANSFDCVLEDEINMQFLFKYGKIAD